MLRALLSASVVAALAGLIAPRTVAQIPCGTAEIVLGQGQGGFNAKGPEYGWSVAMTDDFLAIGSTQFLGDHFGPGWVTVYSASGTSWVAEVPFTGSQSSSDEFGYDVDTDGTWIIAGSPRGFQGPNSANVYFFRELAGGWTETHDFGGPSSYGRSVAVAAPFAAVAAPAVQVDVYSLVGSNWVLDAILPLGSPPWLSNGAVDIDKDVLVIGAEAQNNARGEVSIYENDGSVWQLVSRFSSSDGVTGDQFGAAVDLDDDVLIVGAPYDDDLGGGSGSAYVFRFDGVDWVEEQKLLAPNGAVGDRFGFSADIAGDVIIVGAPNHDTGAGMAYVYRHDGSSWQYESQLFDIGGTQYDYFGHAVATNGVDAVVGAREGGSLSYGVVFGFPLTPLTLLLSSTTPSAGDAISFSVCQGQPTTHTSLVVTKLNGQSFPGYWILAYGAFDATGQWSSRLAVPATLAGMEVTVAAAGAAAGGQLLLSNSEELFVQ